MSRNSKNLQNRGRSKPAPFANRLAQRMLWRFPWIYSNGALKKRNHDSEQIILHQLYTQPISRAISGCKFEIRERPPGSIASIFAKKICAPKTARRVTVQFLKPVLIFKHEKKRCTLSVFIGFIFQLVIKLRLTCL